MSAPRIVDIVEVTKPISSPIRNAYIDFSKMTASLVAVVTNVVRDGRRVVGYGFNSNGRYGQGGLIRERFADRLREADSASLLDETGENLDPHRMALRAPASPAQGTGWLRGWRMTFAGEDVGWDGALSTVVEKVRTGLMIASELGTDSAVLATATSC